jgi:hypothetical protein
MDRSPQPKAESKSSGDEIPGAWERFESAVDAVMKAGPQHRKPAEKAKPVAEDCR